jgi:hypothetical protein
MLYRFLQLDNFFLESIHAPIDASVVSLCLGGCTERDANLVAVVPALFRVKTLPLDGMCKSKSSFKTSGLSNWSRAPMSEISRTMQSTAVPLPSKYTKAR